MKKIFIKYNGSLCPLNQKNKISARNGRAILYNSAEYNNAKKEIQLKIKTHVQAQLNKIGGILSKSDGPLFVDLVIFWKNTADIDAFDKLILDALSGIAYVDDRQIKKKLTEINENQGQSGFLMTIETMGKRNIWTFINNTWKTIAPNNEQLPLV